MVLDADGEPLTQVHLGPGLKRPDGPARRRRHSRRRRHRRPAGGQGVTSPKRRGDQCYWFMYDANGNVTEVRRRDQYE